MSYLIKRIVFLVFTYLELKNELRNAVGCCLRLETTNAAQLLDSTEPKNDTASNEHMKIEKLKDLFLFFFEIHKSL